MGDVPRAAGVDVSIWQRTVDWPTVKNAGTVFAFAKASEGTDFIDPTFATNWPAMQAAGLIRGAYHYYQPAEDPEAQAAHFAQVVGPLALGDMPPVLDVEEKPTVTSAVLIAGVKRCLEAIERQFGRRPLVYTSPGFWGSYMRDDTGAYPGWAASYPLWVAHYTDALAPLLPRGWNSWAFWQYSGSGQVDGVQTPVDLDWFDGTADDLRLWLRLPMVTNQQMINAFAAAFGDDYWTVIVRLSLTGLAIPNSNRALLYTGPAPDVMPGLNDDERARLKEALETLLSASAEREVARVAEPYPLVITNGVLRHAFYLAFGQDYAQRLERAGLVERVTPRLRRDLPYDGPPIEELPRLSKADKRKLLAALRRAQGLRT